MQGVNICLFEASDLAKIERYAWESSTQQIWTYIINERLEGPVLMKKHRPYLLDILWQLIYGKLYIDNIIQTIFINVNIYIIL